MNKKTSLIFGLSLIFFGALTLFHTTIGAIFGFVAGGLWPLLVLGMGLGLCAIPFITQNRNLSPLMIPGMPIATAGVLFLWSNWFYRWDIWGHFWPMMLISVGLGMLATAVYMRNIWFIIPAAIFGLSGLVFQFAALTGWWESMAVLWTVFPFSIGIGLLLTGHLAENRGVRRAGQIMCAIAGGLFVMMGLILAGWFSFWAAILLMGAGVLLLGNGLHGRNTPQLGKQLHPELEFTDAPIHEKSPQSL